jgi:thymidine phosphorylase
VKRGENVGDGDVIARIHARSADAAERAEAVVRKAIVIR